MKIYLNGEWLLRNSDSEEWLKAEVPSCNYTDLLNAGAIPNPFYGTEEQTLRRLGELDWIYRKNFVIGDESILSCDKIRLVCEMLDTVCSLKLNGIPIGDAQNCHQSHSFDIKSVLQKGENVLEIFFASPIEYFSRFHNRYGSPANSNGMTGIVHIRKPQSHFGWDWGPVLPQSGICRDIYIEGISKAEFSDMRIKQTHLGEQVQLEMRADFLLYGLKEIEWKLVISSPDGGKICRQGKSNGKINASVIIENPQLWWTKELSGKDSQPLYNVSIALCGDGKILTEKSLDIGLRTLILDRSRDEYGANFRFILNGIPLFIKGANVIPYDSFPDRTDEAFVNRLLDAAQFSNLNMLRVWGGGYYADDYFYRQCDLRGILVWQDFCFACQAYPFFREDFLNNVLGEVEYNVKRIRHHASLALWCGNNEIEAMTQLWQHKRKYVKWTQKFFYEILPAALRALDADTPYIWGSPCGTDFRKEVASDDVGDTHLWAVWHGLQPPTYYRKRFTRFCSEFGFESLPDIKTLNSFCNEEDLSFSSPVFKAHQKSRGGNAKTVFYITKRFRLPSRFEDYIYLSQLNQHECVKDATEHWRRNRGRCNGSMYWQLNDCWPACSWSSIDYFGRYKALQYTARHFCAPQTLSLTTDKTHIRLWALNDLPTPLSAKIRFYIVDFDGKISLNKIFDAKIDALNSSEIFKLDLKEIKAPKRSVAVAELYIDKIAAHRVTSLFVKEKYVKFDKPNIEKHVSVLADGRAEITLKADKFTRFVRLSHCECDAPFSDNYFDLLPGEEVKITQPAENMSADEYAEGLRLYSLADVQTKGNAVTDAFIFVKTMLNPVNLFSYIYYAINS